MTQFAKYVRKSVEDDVVLKGQVEDEISAHITGAGLEDLDYEWPPTEINVTGKNSDGSFQVECNGSWTAGKWDSIDKEIMRNFDKGSFKVNAKLKPKGGNFAEVEFQNVECQSDWDEES